MPSNSELGSPMTSYSEDVNALQGYSRNEPYSNTYNPGWHNHPNFAWSSQKLSQGPNLMKPNTYGQPSRYTQPCTYQPQPTQENQPTDLSLVLKEMREMNLRHKEEMNQLRIDLMGRLDQLVDARQHGMLPSQPVPNPRNFNRVNQHNTQEKQAHLIQPAPQHPPSFVNPNPTQAQPILQNPPYPSNPNAHACAVTLRSGKQIQDPSTSKSYQDLEEPEFDLGDQTNLENKTQDLNTHDFSQDPFLKP